MKGKYIILMGLVIFLLSGFFDCVSASEKPEFRIGMTPDLSNGVADAGLAEKTGFVLAVDEYNKNPDRKLDVKAIIYDDGCKSDRAISLTMRLVEKDRIHANMNSTCSGATAATMEYLQKQRIVSISPMNSFGPLTLKYKDEPYNFFFRHQAADWVMGPTMGKWVADKGYKKIACIYETTGFGTEGNKALAKYLKSKYNMDLAASVSMKYGQTEVTAEVTRLMKSGADAVAIYCYPLGAARVVITADRLNYRPQFVAPVSSSQPAQVKMSGADRVEGLRVYMNFDRGSKKGKEFMAKLTAYAGRSVAEIAPHWAATAYDAARMLIMAAEAVGPDNSEKMVRYLEDFQFSGPTWEGRPFTREDHDSFKPEHSWMAVYRNGGLVTEEK
jgi:branched-chain amino acid transport system substrate-binding protein